MMKHYLTLLATTRNNNSADSVACSRIIEIYHFLKQDKNLPTKEIKNLLREALQLKKIPEEEINAFLTPPVHLFCFPYAGGNSALYDKWQAHLPTQIKLLPIEYAGRGSKSREKLIPNLKILLSDLEKEVLSKLSTDVPFAFFGHSLGAIIAFELASLLKDKYNLSPIALFLSGSPPPDVVSSFPSMSSMNDQEFIATIQDLNGVPKALIETEEFKTFFLPILRNDFSLLDTYSCNQRALMCPFITFGGKYDPKVSILDIKRWESWTKIGITLHEIEGDHFFIHQPSKVIEKIRESLCLILS